MSIVEAALYMISSNYFFEAIIKTKFTLKIDIEKQVLLINQCYFTTNSYLFYEVVNSYKFVWPHSYDFVQFV